MAKPNTAALLIGLAPKAKADKEEPVTEEDESSADLAYGEAFDALKRDDREAFVVAMRSACEMTFAGED